MLATLVDGSIGLFVVGSLLLAIGVEENDLEESIAQVSTENETLDSSCLWNPDHCALFQ